MGNRAIIIPEGKNIGVYLHWNGGIDSVTAFLEYCKLKNYRDFGGNNFDGYGMARFMQVVGNFFGGTTSIGIETNVYPSGVCAEGLDNGIYVVKGWDIVNRIGCQSGPEGYDLKEMLLSIDECQPENEQLGAEFLLADEVDVSEIKIGDKVFVSKWEEKPEIHTVVGIAPPNTFHNGDVSNLPYVDLYDHDGDYSWNCNNYLRGRVRRYKPAENEDDNEISTFRMYADVKFNRPINKEKDYISFGGYCMNMKGKDVQFDFEDYSSEIDKEDPYILHITCKNPDYDTFEDLENITKDMLENVEGINEFVVCAGEPEESDLEPVSIEFITFVLPYDNWDEIEVKKEVLKKIEF